MTHRIDHSALIYLCLILGFALLGTFTILGVQCSTALSYEEILAQKSAYTKQLERLVDEKTQIIAERASLSDQQNEAIDKVSGVTIMHEVANEVRDGMRLIVKATTERESHPHLDENGVGQ